MGECWPSMCKDPSLVPTTKTNKIQVQTRARCVIHEPCPRASYFFTGLHSYCLMRLRLDFYRIIRNRGEFGLLPGRPNLLHIRDTGKREPRLRKWLLDWPVDKSVGS